MGELICSDHPRKDDEEIDISVFSAEHAIYAVKHAWHHKYMERYWAGTESEIASALCPGWDQSCVQPCKTPIKILHINEPSYLSSVTHTWNYNLDFFFLMQWLRVEKKCHGQASVCLYWVSQHRLKVSAFKRWDVTPWLQRAPCCWQVAHPAGFMETPGSDCF